MGAIATPEFDRGREGELDLWFARWTLRALVELGVWRRLLRGGRSLDEELLAHVGLEALVDQKLEPAQLSTLLRERLRTLESRRSRKQTVLHRNVALLGDALGLTAAERDVVVLTVAMYVCAPLAEVIEKLPLHTVPELSRALSRLLHHPLRDVSSALRRDGALLSTGLIFLTDVERHRGLPVRPMDGLPNLLLEPQDCAEGLVAHFFRSPKPPTLTLEDFPHAKDDVELLRRLLGSALEQRALGVNVLLHGAPGTGKTELVRALAHAIGAPLYEVNDQDPDGDPLPNHRRFHAYALCQRVVAPQPRALVLFDEIEDVFPRASNADAYEAAPGKAWTNRALEENAAPALWVSNSIEQIDPAYLRRFDLIVELRAPRADVRRKMLARALGPHLPDEAWVRRMSADDRLTPAHVERAAKVARLVAPSSQEQAGRVLSRVLDRALAVQRAAPPALLSLADGPTYDLRRVNANVDLEKLVASLQQQPRGAICLHGAPGTGKTAFAQHVADRLRRPLLVRRASDLISCYLGQTEVRLAEMFQRARAEDAVLFLDEADSFLQERASAVRSWEVTQVNELLVQMESFEGLFLAATNAFDRLDAASLRRFTLKIRFDAPTADQRWALFCDALSQLGVPAPQDVDVHRLRTRMDRLHGVTPGDFRTVLRQARLLSGFADAARVLDALEQEVRARPDARRASVGFDAHRLDLS